MKNSSVASTPVPIQANAYQGLINTEATQKFVVYNGSEQFPMAKDTEAIGLIAFLELLK